MQAIILAAGMGRRLGELTKNNTKCMVEVNGITLIDRLLGQLSGLALSRVVIVVGYEGEKLKRYIGNRFDSALKIEYVENPIYDKTNNIYSLALAKEYMMEEDTLLIESDLIFEDRLFAMILENPYPNLALVAKYESWMDGTMVRIDSECNILDFVPKHSFNYDEADSYYKTVNIYKLSKEFSTNIYIPFLEAYTKALGNNEYYEQVLRVITFLDKVELKALPIGDERWYEIDDVQDLDIAETIFSEGEVQLKKYMSRYGGYWRFPKLLDFCYLVNPYFPTEKMKNELRANFDVLLTEYPSGMSVNSLLAGKYFGINQEYVCVGNGAAELIKTYMEKHVSGKIGVIYPTFEEYPNRFVADNIVRFIPRNSDFSYAAGDLQSFFDDKGISTLLLINPDNPSGNFISMADLGKLISWTAERGITLVVDESFVDFSEQGTDNTLLHNEILSANGHLVVVKSISKSYGVPGLRLGVLASGNTVLVASMKKEVAIWNINSFAEYYMQIFGKYESDYRMACKLFVNERSRFFNELKNVSYLRVIPSQANYFLCEIIDKYTSKELAELLLSKYNILIKDCGSKSAFAGSNYIRVAVRNKTENDYLLSALKTL